MNVRVDLLMFDLQFAIRVIYLDQFDLSQIILDLI
jgi:hypothetical protein